MCGGGLDGFNLLPKTGKILFSWNRWNLAFGFEWLTTKVVKRPITILVQVKIT